MQYLINIKSINIKEKKTRNRLENNNHFYNLGHCAGYIKVWYLANYLVSDPPEIDMIHLRLEFPFLWKDRILGRAKRAVRDQPLPLLLSSVRGHLKSITSVQIIPDARIIIR